MAFQIVTLLLGISRLIYVQSVLFHKVLSLQTHLLSILAACTYPPLSHQVSAYIGKQGDSSYH